MQRFTYQAVIAGGFAVDTFYVLRYEHLVYDVMIIIYIFIYIYYRVLSIDNRWDCFRMILDCKNIIKTFVSHAKIVWKSERGQI